MFSSFRKCDLFMCHSSKNVNRVLMKQRFFSSKGSNLNVASTNPFYLKLMENLTNVRNELLNHPLYNSIKSTKHVQKFMNVHVFCVWDFMNLVMALKQRIAPIRIPWTAPTRSQSARFINEILVGEESDEMPKNSELGFQSHLGLYLE